MFFLAGGGEVAHLAGGFSLPNAVAAAWVMNGKRRAGRSRENYLAALLQGFLSQIALGDQGGINLSGELRRLSVAA